MAIQIDPVQFYCPKCGAILELINMSRSRAVFFCSKGKFVCWKSTSPPYSTQHNGHNGGNGQKPI
jgi:hypothetical protein